MAAAAFSSSRAATGFIATRGLFLIFTLLCLVCVASSLMNKGKLEKLKEDLQKLQQNTERKLADHMLDSAFISEVLGDVIHLMDPTIAILRKTMYDFLPLVELMEDTKSFLEESKPYIDKEIEDGAAEIEDYKQNLKSLEKLLTGLENHDEL